MGARDDLFEKFGPSMIEALVLVILDEINVLRTELGLAERTASQIMPVMESKIASLPAYEQKDDLFQKG